MTDLHLIDVSNFEGMSMLDHSEKRTKFVRLAEGRTQDALGAIRKLGNLSNRRSYEWNESDIRKISKVLREAISEMERKFDPQGAPESKFKL